MHNNQPENTYTFQGMRFIPSYRDFDHDDVDIVAVSEEAAWKKLNENYKYWKSVGITHINGIEVKHQPQA